MPDESRRRVASIAGHLTPMPCSSNQPSMPPGPKKLDGWGYTDTEFFINSEGDVQLSGNRYMFSGQTLPDLRPFCEEFLGLDVKQKTPIRPYPPLPFPYRNEAFIAALASTSLASAVAISFDSHDRLDRGHGHTAEEIYSLRIGKFDRLPDAVVFPKSTEEVLAIVMAANTYGVCLIPYGGGTSVSWGLLPPHSQDTRMITVVDMNRYMNRLVTVDAVNMTAVVQAGMIGRDLETELSKKGLTMGHEPDSIEFSTMGGWVATRASGMRKNVYGNIEDIVVNVTMVTPRGILKGRGWDGNGSERNPHIYSHGCESPRVSAGPDLQHIILGSEGTLGIVTEVLVRLRRLPEVKTYGSVLFPSFEAGVAAMRNLVLQGCFPASMRLVDNEQFRLGLALKPKQSKSFSIIKDRLKKLYVLKVLGFSPTEMCAMTLMFEGSASAVSRQEALLYSTCSTYGGLKAGAENGLRGYFLTFTIAYLRDFAFSYQLVGESFETSVPWSSCLSMCSAVKSALKIEGESMGFKVPPFLTCRVTQAYDTGVCVYFYMGINVTGISDPIPLFSRLEDLAREVIIQQGGSISHHHGVGKLRKKFFGPIIGDVGMDVLKAVKKSLDPNNVFGSLNIMD